MEPSCFGRTSTDFAKVQSAAVAGRATFGRKVASRTAGSVLAAELSQHGRVRLVRRTNAVRLGRECVPLIRGARALGGSLRDHADSVRSERCLVRRSRSVRSYINLHRLPHCDALNPRFAFFLGSLPGSLRLRRHCGTQRSSAARGKVVGVAIGTCGVHARLAGCVEDLVRSCGRVTAALWLTLGVVASALGQWTARTSDRVAIGRVRESQR